MIGAIIGDIVGSVYEFNNIKTKDFLLFGANNFFTDDTILTCAVYKALDSVFGKNADKKIVDRVDKIYDEKKTFLENNIAIFNEKLKFLPDSTVKYMKEFGRKYESGGYGERFKAWLNSDDKSPYFSYGNGAGMRISPVVLFAHDIESAKKLSYAITSVTHNHPEGIKGAEATAVATFMALKRSPKAEIKKYIEENYYSLDFNYEQLKKEYGVGYFPVLCQNTIPQAIWCFLESEDFEDCLRIAVSIGGDTDTLCAIAGGIASAYYGVSIEIFNQAKLYLDEGLGEIYQKMFEHYRWITKFSCVEGDLNY